VIKLKKEFQDLK
jgi:hypothetical protein